MENPVLVDSSIFIGLLRQGVDPSSTLLEWAGDRDLAICGIVRMEVIRGVRLPRVRHAVEGFLDAMWEVPTDTSLWREAVDLAWHLDRTGIILPVQDLLIAASALRIGAGILTDDRHFRLIPGIVVAGGLREILRA